MESGYLKELEGELKTRDSSTRADLEVEITCGHRSFFVHCCRMPDQN